MVHFGPFFSGGGGVQHISDLTLAGIDLSFCVLDQDQVTLQLQFGLKQTRPERSWWEWHYAGSRLGICLKVVFSLCSYSTCQCLLFFLYPISAASSFTQLNLNILIWFVDVRDSWCSSVSPLIDTDSFGLFWSSPLAQVDVGNHWISGSYIYCYIVHWEFLLRILVEPRSWIILGVHFSAVDFLSVKSENKASYGAVWFSDSLVMLGIVASVLTKVLVWSFSCSLSPAWLSYFSVLIFSILMLCTSWPVHFLSVLYMSMGLD